MKTRLRNLAATPLEVWVDRDGTQVFAGPVIGGEIQGPNVKHTAKGLLYYLAYVLVMTDRPLRRSTNSRLLRPSSTTGRARGQHSPPHLVRLLPRTCQTARFIVSTIWEDSWVFAPHRHKEAQHTG